MVRESLRSRSKSASRARRRGAVMVEYALLLVAVGIPAIAGLSAGGLATYNTYVRARNTMLLPIP